MLAHAEDYASKQFNPEKIIMHVLSSRNELIAFYLRRGYQRTQTTIDYPLAAGVGTPLHDDLKVEVLEKTVRGADP